MLDFFSPCLVTILSLAHGGQAHGQLSVLGTVSSIFIGSSLLHVAPREHH